MKTMYVGGYGPHVKRLPWLKLGDATGRRLQDVIDVVDTPTPGGAMDSARWKEHGKPPGGMVIFRMNEYELWQAGVDVTPALWVDELPLDRRWTTVALAFVVAEQDGGKLRWLLDSTNTVFTNTVEVRRMAGANWLLEPLQPALVDMGTEVYHHFAKDRPKYAAYAQAVLNALEDMPGAKVVVVGAGTGGIVDQIPPRYSEMVVIEKNPRCFPVLSSKSSAWPRTRLFLDRVENFTETGDIVILEMLGLFGDNEMFPEIGHRFPKGAISIPQHYSLWIYPIYTTVPMANKQMYVAKLTKYYPVASPQQLWSFPGGLNRRVKCKFVASTLGKINAFIGTFQATLYRDVVIHNCPATNGGIYCRLWFPVVFPVDEAFVKKGEEIEVEMVRVGGDRVWYEWTLGGKVYNKGGSQGWLTS